MANDEIDAVVPKKDERADVGIESGIDAQLAFTSSFQESLWSIGTGQTSRRRKYAGELFEVMRPQMPGSPSLQHLTMMRRADGQARALYRLLTLPIRSAFGTAKFVPEDGDTGEAEFVEQALMLPRHAGGMETPFPKVVSHLMLALFNGFSAFEQVFWIPDSGPLAGKMTYQKIAYRPPETLTFVCDEKGDFAGFRQQAWLGGRTLDVYIPPENSFYYAAQEEENKFYGLSYFEAAYHHFDKKQKMYFTANLAAQRAAVGTRIGKYPASATQSQLRDFSTNLANLALAQWMAIPDTFALDILKEGGNFDFINQINHHNSQMSKSVLASFFDQDQGQSKTGGSLVSFAQPGDEMFVLMLRAIMDEVAEIINREIIPQIVDYNFDSPAYPKFTWGSLTDSQQEAVSATFDKLASAGESLNVTPEFMRELEKMQAEAMGLEIDYDAVEAREEEEKAEAERQQEEMMAMQNAVPEEPAAPFDDAAAAQFEASIAGGGVPSAGTDPAAAVAEQDVEDPAKKKEEQDG